LDFYLLDGKTKDSYLRSLTVSSHHPWRGLYPLLPDIEDATMTPSTIPPPAQYRNFDNEQFGARPNDIIRLCDVEAVREETSARAPGIVYTPS
ncbi:hypothetical protein PMAYCL1PPCAC_24169, partial [Pristionchus mayeri]